LREYVQQESQIKTLKAQEASNPKSRNFAVTLSYVDPPLTGSCGEECKGDQGSHRGALLRDK